MASRMVCVTVTEIRKKRKFCIEKNKLMRILLTETFENVLNNIAPDIAAYEGQFTVEFAQAK